MRESELSKAVRDYLQYQANLGKVYFDRLNSGSLLAKSGDRIYKVNLCKSGTADYFVIQWVYPQGAPNKGWTRVIFLELKGKDGKQRGDQKDFQVSVEKQGAEYHIIRNIDELIGLIKESE